jgi:hypothetical protein
MDSYNAKRERGLSAFDRRNLLVLSYVYPLPFWREPNTWYRKVWGGWQLSGITTIETGMPVNITIQGDVAGTGVGGQRPNVVGDPLLNAHTVSRWFNPAAFAVPAAGTFGNLGRDAIVGPGANNWDFSAQKYFAFTERVKLQYRAEMFNAPNHVSFWSMATTVGASNFGQVTGAMDPRTFQMVLKLLF